MMKKKYLYVSFLAVIFSITGIKAQCVPPNSAADPVEGEFGDNEWIAYAYNYSGGYDNSTFDFSDYRGYYIDSGYGTGGTSFDSSTAWTINTNPGNASGYVGCTVTDNKHNVIYKRKGFPAASNYIISVQGENGEAGHDDAAQLYIDGSLVWDNTGCCNSVPHVWSGSLDADSEVVFQWSDDGGDSYGRLNIEALPAEDTSFGEEEWKVGVYTGSDFNSYRGSYIHTGVSFNTTDLWPASGNPSEAVTYNGASVGNDNHSYVYRREGFDCGYYHMDVVRHDDGVEVIIDNVSVFQQTGYDGGAGAPDIWEGYLDSNSKVEIKLNENGGESRLAVDFNYIFGAQNSDEYMWIGSINSDPTEAGNWCGSMPPNDSTASILIPENVANFPYYGGAANLNNIVIQENAEITLVAGTVLNIYGDLENNGTIHTTDTDILFVGTSAQTFSGNGINVENFTVNNSNGVSLDLNTDEVLNIQNILDVSSGTFTTNNQVLLACKFSDPDNRTAQIGNLTNGDIAGLITVEQCFPARRAFRLISPSVTTITGIRENWQEGQNNTGTNFSTDNQNIHEGYGTHITGSQTGQNGFDATPSGNPSLFIFNNAVQSWSAIGNTNSNTLTAGDPYRLMIRGSRAINVTSNTATPTNTILRTQGTVQKGTINVNSFNGTSGSYNFFGNPYHAAINVTDLFGDAGTTNVNTNYYYVWDPTLGGTPTPGIPGGRGGFCYSRFK